MNILAFFKRLFQRNKVKELPAPKIEKVVVSDFRKDIVIKENKELLKCKQLYEEGKVQVENLSIKQIEGLVKLYENELQELQYKITQAKLRRI